MTVTVRQLMTPHPVVVESGTSIADCARLMDSREIGAIGVVEGGRLWGVLTDRDIVVRAVARGLDLGSVTVERLATRDVVAVPVDSTVEDAERRMRDRAVRRLFVVAEDGSPVGILSVDDLTAFRDPESIAAHQLGEWGIARSDQGFTGSG